jgi:hypothetical protein
MCMDALDKLSRLWEIGEPEDRQGMARSLFSYVVFDLDSRRIVDFRLKPWADRFLVLRATLYKNENGPEDPDSGPTTGSEPVSRDVLPEGFEPPTPGSEDLRSRPLSYGSGVRSLYRSSRVPARLTNANQEMYRCRRAC